MKKNVEKTRFTIIHCADFDAYKDEHVTLTESEQVRNEDSRITWPLNCYCVLVQHPVLGNVLFDTGIDSRWQARWPRNLADGYPVHRSFDLKVKLRELDLYVDDIDYVIISHLHFDHAGNLWMFRGTKAGTGVIVQEEEARHAFLCANRYDCAEETYHGDGYVRHEFNGLDGIAFELVRGDVKLADDLELVLLPGHTPGTMGLVVRTENTGTVVFPSDAVYNHFNYGPPAMKPGMCARPEEFVGSIEKVRRIVESENGKLFYSHDVETFADYKKSPLTQQLVERKRVVWRSTTPPQKVGSQGGIVGCRSICSNRGYSGRVFLWAKNKTTFNSFARFSFLHYVFCS